MPNKLPTAEDVALGRKYDVGYGQSTYPGEKGRITDFESFKDWLGSGTFSRTEVAKFSPEQLQDLEIAWHGARKSAIATIGFDPHALVQLADKATATNPAGAYMPKADEATVYDAKGKAIRKIEQHRGHADTMYTDQLSAASTAIHEAIHRGFEKMREAGVKGLPKEGMDEEIAVRALMLKHVGNAEHESELKVLRALGVTEKIIKEDDADKVLETDQIGRGYLLLRQKPQELDKWERLAQEYLAKERKGRRGPA